MMGKAKTQQRLIDNLEDEFAKVQHFSPEYNHENQHIQFTILALIIPILLLIYIGSEGVSYAAWRFPKC